MSDYVKPADVALKIINVGAVKLATPVRDLLIRGALSGALLGVAIPVMLGNIVGGFLFTGLATYWTYRPASLRSMGVPACAPAE